MSTRRQVKSTLRFDALARDCNCPAVVEAARWALARAESFDAYPVAKESSPSGKVYALKTAPAKAYPQHVVYFVLEKSGNVQLCHIMRSQAEE